MTEGLIHSFEGRLLLLGVWAVFAFFAVCALMVLIVARKAPPLTTQLDHRTGVKEHGVFRWLFTLSALFLGPPVLAFMATVLAAAVDWVALSAPVWLLPVAASAVLLVAVVWAVRRYRPAPARPTPVVPRAPVGVVPAPEPPPMWSLPEDVGQWDHR